MTDQQEVNVKKFNVLDDVSINNDRVCFYFGFDPNLQVGYAAKQSVDGTITQIKSYDINDIIAWLAFSPLAEKLLNSKGFNSKYSTKITVINEGVKVVTINTTPYFFYKEEGRWFWTQSPKDMEIKFGESIVTNIDNIMGFKFCQKTLNEIKDNEQSTEDFKQTSADIKELVNRFKNNTLIQDNKGEASLPIIDVNDSCSTVN